MFGHDHAAFGASLGPVAADALGAGAGVGGFGGLFSFELVSGVIFDLLPSLRRLLLVGTAFDARDAGLDDNPRSDFGSANRRLYAYASRPQVVARVSNGTGRSLGAGHGVVDCSGLATGCD